MANSQMIKWQRSHPRPIVKIDQDVATVTPYDIQEWRNCVRQNNFFVCFVSILCSSNLAIKAKMGTNCSLDWIEFRHSNDFQCCLIKTLCLKSGWWPAITSWKLPIFVHIVTYHVYRDLHDSLFWRNRTWLAILWRLYKTDHHVDVCVFRRFYENGFFAGLILFARVFSAL